ncbi:unnamed protein product [Lymnaea stagnalis]|uniref:G-protein coupled receptors family 1 profile domain-containing protein n=1 Tax=Lymnaea stagnalis TaxID=6523 RepID=A0AAV2H8M6_LYMST
MHATWMFACVYLTLGVFGSVTKTVNIRAFVRMGPGDSVTASFLCLSLSDLGFLLTTVGVGAFSFLWAVEMGTSYETCFAMDPFAGYVISANASFLLYVMSTLTTMFLAVARCMCVARPLHFKNTFTLARTVAVLLGCAVFTVGSYLPVLANMGVDPKFDVRVNFSRPLLWITTEREFIKVIVWTVRDTVLSMTSQVVLLVCVIIMAARLRKATAFRQMSVSTSGARTAPPLGSQVTQLGRRDLQTVRRATQAAHLGRKDLQIVRQVLLISLVYVVCNMPKILVNIAGIFESELTIGKQYQNLSIATINIMTISQMFHSSINLVIYYKFNAKFRSNCAL